MKTVGFDNASSERSREPVMLEQSEVSKNAGVFTPNNNHCKSNFKKKPALCEQQLLSAANKDKEWGMFERWIIMLLLFHEKRVTPFPYLLRQDNNGKNKTTEGCCLQLASKVLFDL